MLVCETKVLLWTSAMHLRGGMRRELTESQNRLLGALEAFSASPRFALFQSVEIARLLPEGSSSIKALDSITFEELLKEMRQDGRLTGLSEGDEDTLVEIVRFLSEDSGQCESSSMEVLSPHHLQDSLCGIAIPTLDDASARGETSRGSPYEKPPVQEQDKAIIGSVSLELALREGLKRIADHSLYDSVKSRLLGEFWDPAWTPAPFEEAMSIAQFIALDPGVLFKKRMVTDTRIQSIVEALKRVNAFLEAEDSPGKDKPFLQLNPARGRLDSSLSEDGHKDIQGSSLSMFDSLESHAIWELMCHHRPESPFIRVVRDQFSPEQCVGLVLGLGLTTTLLKRLEGLVKSEFAGAKLDVIVALLRGPGVSINQIAHVLHENEIYSNAYSRSIATLVTRALGAVPVMYKKRVCCGFWTLQPKLVTAILEAKFTARGACAGKMQTSLSKVRLDPFLHRWIESQGFGKKNRKESRNQLKRRR